MINDSNFYDKIEEILDINIKGEWKAFKIHHKGPRVINFDDYLKKEMTEEEKENIFNMEINEIQINPSFNWTFPRDKETKHFFIVGAPGSGKTQLLIPWIFDVRRRGDKVFLYDNKGDFTEILEELDYNELILVAPWDKRGFAWEIGKDIFNKQLAREFAVKAIPEGEEPLYSNSARLLLVGSIVYLQDTKGINWDFADLYNVLTLPREKLYEIMFKYYPEAAELIREPTKLSQNIMTNLMAAISMIADLADIWKDTKKKFSVRELIQRDESFTLVMQGSGIYREMANTLIGSIIMSAAAEIETLNDDDSRRLWFFLDEFPQLGELPGFTPLLEIGRSKGVAVVIAMQNINQIIDIYGEETAKSIQAMCNTQFYGRLPLGSTANFISDFLGEREIIKVIPDLNNQLYAQNYKVNIEYEKSVPEFVLSNELGAFPDGIKMIMVGLTKDHLLIQYPYSSVEKIREKNVWADWTVNYPVSTTPSKDGSL